MRTFTAGQWKCQVDSNRGSPRQISSFIPIPLRGPVLLASLGKALGRGLVGYTSPLPSRPPPTRGMRQWRGAWGRPSPAPPYKLELAPYQSHPPAAPPRKACSRGDDDPAAALPMSSPLLPGDERRGPQRAASPANGEREGWGWTGLAVGVTCGRWQVWQGKGGLHTGSELPPVGLRPPAQ